MTGPVRSLFRCALLAGLTVGPAAAPVPGQTNSTWNGTTGNWTDAARWSTNPNFPNNGNGGVNYNAVVNSGAVTVNQDITVSGFTLTGGSVGAPGSGGPFTLTAIGTLSLHGGTFGAGQTLQSGGATTVTNSQGGPTINGTWNNTGTVNAANVAGSGVINNQAGASYTFNGSGLVGSGTFNNSGTVVVVTPVGTGFNLQTNWNFNNKAGGVVNGSNTSIQFFATGTHDGTFNMTSSALQFQAGSNNTFTASSVVTGSIDFYPFGGTVTVNGTYTPSGLTWVGTGNATATFNSAFGGTGGLRIDSGGVVNLNQPTTLTNLSLNNGGTLAGSGALTLNGTTNVSINGGTLAGTAAAAVQNIGTLRIAGTNQSNLAHNLTNAGGAVINWSNTGPLALATGIVLTNEPNANFNATGHVDLYGRTTPSEGVFNNFGTFTKSSDAGTIAIRSTFHNRAGATVNVQTGTLNIANPGTLAGTFNTSAGATIMFSGTQTLPGVMTFAGSGTVAVGGGTTTLSGTLTVPSFTLTGGTLAGSGALVVDSLTLSGGTVGRDLSANGAVSNSFTGGTLTVGNGFTLTIPAGRTLQAAAGAIAGPGAFANQGTLTKTGGGTLTIGGPYTGAAGAAVQVAGGTLQFDGPSSHTGGINVVAGASVAFNASSTIAAGTTFTGAGAVKTLAGTTTLSGPTTIPTYTLAGGTLAGSGGLTTTNLTLTGGTVDGPTLQTNGAGTITNSQGVPVINATWANLGSITGASDIFGNGGSIRGSGVINNLAGGTFTLGGVNVFGAGTFNNFGTVAAYTPSGTGFGNYSYRDFHNKAGGTVTVGNGSINFLAAGVHDGAFVMTGDASIGFYTGGTATFNAGSSITGTGSVLFASDVTFGGTMNFNGTLTVAGPATFTSNYTHAGNLRVDAPGVASFSLPTTLTKLWIVSGTIAGPGAITLNGTGQNVLFEGGTLGGTSPTAIQNLSTLWVQETSVKTLAHDLNNASGGVINWSGGPFNLKAGVTLTNASGATFNASANADFSGHPTPSVGTLDNYGTLNRSSGTGTLDIFSTFHNRPGATVNVQAGTLNLANVGTLGGTFDIASGATLAFSGTQTLPGSATFTGNGTLAATGGTTTLTGTLAVSNFALNGGTVAGTGTLTVGSLTLSGGTLGRDFAVNGTSSNTFTGGTLTVGNGFTLSVPTGRTLQTASGTIAGPGAVVNQGSLTKTGTGTLNFGGSFTNAAGAAVQVTNGTLQFNGPVTLEGAVNVAAGATVAFNSDVSLTGTGGFTGAGSVRTNGGTTTFAAPVSIANYMLAGGTLAGTGPLTTNNLTVAGGTLGRNLAANGTTSNNFAGGTLTIANGFTLTIPNGATLQATGGTIAGTGAVANQGTLTKTGTGTVAITALFTNATGAAVQVQGGTLSLGGSTLDGAFAVASGASLDLAAGATVLSTATVTGAGKLTTSAVNVTVNGGGTSNYSGGTVVNSGGSLLATGSGPALGTGNVTVASGGTLRLTAATNIGATAKVDVPAGAILGLEAAFDPSTILTPASAGVVGIDTANFSTALSMATLGNGQMFLGSATAGAYAAATLTPASGNVYRLGGGGGTLTLGAANVLSGATMAAVGASGLTGTVRLTAANNYTGGTTLAAGTLAIGATGALGTGPLAITGGTLQADGGAVTVSNAVTLGGNVTIAGADVLTLGGNVTLTGNRTVTVSGTSAAVISGNVGGDVIGRSFTKAGTGTLTLSGTNTYGGGTVVNEGTLRTTGGNQALGLGNVTVNSGAVLRQAAFSNLGGGTSVRVNSGGVIGLDGNFPPSLDPASVGTIAINSTTYSQPLNQSAMGNGQMFLGTQGTGQYNAATLGAGTGSAYRLGAAGGTLTIPTANVLTGFNSLLVGSTQVNGAGTVVLGAGQDFQGNTTINDGSTLVLQANLTGPGTVFILPGATLAGSGFADGYVNLGGTVSPGFSPGTLTFTNGFGFGAGSQYRWELAALTTTGGGTAYDQVAVTSGVVTVDPGADLNVEFTAAATMPTDGDPFWHASRTWPIVTLSGSATTAGPLTFRINNSPWSAAGTFATMSAVTGPGVNLVWTPTVITAQTWAGTVDTNWNAAGNWDPATVPNSATRAITFGATGAGPVNIASSVQAQSLTFVNATDNYTLTSSPDQTLSGVTAITVDSGVTGTQTINLANVATGSLSFPAGSPLTIANNAAAGASPTLVIGPNTVIGTTGTGGVNVGGTGVTRISGTFAGGVTGGLTKTGTGRLELTGDSANLSGPGNVAVTLSGGTLAVNADVALGAVTQSLKLDADSAMAGGLEFLSGGVTIARPVTLASTTRIVSKAADTNTISGVISGPGQLVKAGSGALTLTGANTYAGGTTVGQGVLAVAADAALGAATGPVTVAGLGTLTFTGSTTTARAFTLTGGEVVVGAGQSLTLNGAVVGGGFLRGPGTFSLTGGATLAGVTTLNTTVMTQPGAASYTNFTHGGSLTVAGGPAAPATLNGFTNQGSGSITVAAGSRVNAADFQTYGLLTLNPGSTAAPTQVTNTGLSPLFFNGGSRTFVGTPATAAQFPAGIDLNGKNAVVAGGLFVNNGFVVDSAPGSPGRVVADFGALVKGTGFFQSPVVTQNGGRFQAGNSPGTASFGSFSFGPGGVDRYVFSITDADGAAGQVTGWGVVRAVRQDVAGAATPGDFVWAATPAARLTVALETLFGGNEPGPMADFDPGQRYDWPAVTWAGAYTGPADGAALTAATTFDASGFLNPVGGVFGWALDAGAGQLSLTYTPVPEPGTLALAGVAAVGWVTFRHRRRQANGLPPTLSP